MSKALVSGAIANKAFRGGAVWTRLNWTLGLKKLGYDVYFVEQIEPQSCVDLRGAVTSFMDSENLKYFRTIMHQFGLEKSSALIYDGGKETWGLGRQDLMDVADAADVLINISGHLKLKDLKQRVRCKVYIDLDPGFTQFWHAAGQIGSSIEDHDFYFTIGENIGNSGCCIPTSGIYWHTTRQPIVLEHWPASDQGQRERFTTIASWRGPYGPIAYGNKRLGVKAHEFRKLSQLPKSVNATFEIALDIHEADQKDRELLESNGWKVRDPRLTVSDPVSFRQYVQTSGAEFSVAQEMYTETNSGWFSDRTVRYLASGKPALVQDTGFSEKYPIGEGLISFRTFDEAVIGAKRILDDYPAHCRTARKLAEEYFASDKVLRELAKTVGVAPS